METVVLPTRLLNGTVNAQAEVHTPVQTSVMKSAAQALTSNGMNAMTEI